MAYKPDLIIRDKENIVIRGRSCTRFAVYAKTCEGKYIFVSRHVVESESRYGAKDMRCFKKFREDRLKNR